MRVPMACLLASVLTAACAGGSPSRPGPLELPDRWEVRFRADVLPYRTVVPAPIERVAPEVEEVYRLMGLAAARATNTEDLLFITPNLRITGRLYEGEWNSDYLDCGEGFGGQRANTDEIRFAAYTRLTEEVPGETVVETQLGGTAVPREGVASTGSAYCSGTGKLEQRISDLLRARASARRGP